MTYLNDTDTMTMNRRHSEREKVAFTAVVWPDQEDLEVRSANAGSAGLQVALVNNLSMTGLSFQSRVAYPVDAILWVRVRMGSKTCQFKGKVRRSSRASSGKSVYQYGVQFIHSQQTTHAQSIVVNYFNTYYRRAHK